MWLWAWRNVDCLAPRLVQETMVRRMARGGERGVSPIMLVWDGRVQWSVSWRSEAIICGLGSRVPACLRLPAGRREAPEVRVKSHRTKVIISLKAAGRNHAIQQGSHRRYIGRGKRRGTKEVREGNGGRNWYLETIVVEGKDGGRQGLPFIREHSGCAQGLQLRT